MKSSSFPNANEAEYPQDEESYGYFAGGDRHYAERLGDPVYFDEKSLASCRQIVYMSATPFARVERPDSREREEENLVPLDLPDLSNHGTAHQGDHDEQIIDPHAANDHYACKYAQSDHNEGNRAFDPGEGENAWCSVLITAGGSL